MKVLRKEEKKDVFLLANTLPLIKINKSQVASLLLFLSHQEIMVGSMFQAEIPAGTCKYKENEKGEI